MRRSLLLFLLSLFAFQAEASSPGHGGSFGLVSGEALEHGTWGPGVKTDAGFSPIPNGPTPIFELTGTNGTTATDGTTPTTATRSSDAYRTDCSGGVNSLTTVTSNVIRIGSYCDSTGEFRRTAQIEGAATNLLTYSEDFSNPAWTKNFVSVSQSGASTARDSSKTFWRVIPAAATSFSFSFGQDVTVANSTQYAVAVDVKAGASDWMRLEFRDSVQSGFVYFNAATATVGSSGGALNPTGYAEDKGGGVVRVVAVATTGASGGGTGRVNLLTASGDGAASYTGDGSTAAFEATFAQVETGAYASSYIPTTSASATRAADALMYGGLSILDSGAPFTISTYALREGVDAFGGVVAFSNGGLTTERALLFYNGADSPVAQVIASSSTQASITALSVFSAGAWQHLQLTADTDSFEYFVDGASEGTDTSGSLPTGLDQVTVGAYQSGSNIRGGLIGLPLRLYDKVVTP